MDWTPVDDYAQRVVSGEVPGGKYHRLACARHLRDRERVGVAGFAYHFDWTKADLFLRFLTNLKHYKGRQFAGRPIAPTDNQVFRLGCLFGWRDAAGLRRFTTAYNELPRKTGKTLEAAAVGIYATFFEGESGAEGYCIATKKDQARRVFDDAKRLVMSSDLKSRIKVTAHALFREGSASTFQALGADADSTDGLNPHVIISDELHAWKVRDLLDVMETATGARLNPLHFQITTAGSDPVSPCGDQHDYACKILDGVIEDASTDAFFAFIAHADPDDDPWAEATWRKANPHYGISVEPADLQKLALKAQQMPSAAAEFLQKRLNLWVNADAPWLSTDGWRAGQSSWSLDEMAGEACWGGVDLSSKIDLTAFVLVFPPTQQRVKWRVACWAFTPADTLEDRAHRDRAPYDVWANQGYIDTCPGKRIDYAQVLACIAEAKQRFRVQAIGFDPWNAEDLQTDLRESVGFGEQQILEVPQNYTFMSPPAKDVEADVLGGLIDAGGNPLMAWTASNAVAARDAKDNIFLTKKKSRGRIDPLVALVIARAVHKRLGLVEVQTRKVRAYVV